LSIRELPAINWITLHSNNDFTQLSKTGKICHRARLVFERIRDEVIDEFGVTSEFLSIHKANIRIELMKAELMQTGDRSLIFHIEIEEKLLADMLNPMKSVNLYDAMVWIKRQGISFEENKVSTFWFLKYMDHLMKQVRKNKKPETAKAHGRK
jgi:hypothetical protein